MVAYSYKQRFVVPIRVGLGLETSGVVKPKRQTIRSIGKRRHARPGEALQHYCGMRQPGCFKIGDAICTDTKAVQIDARVSHFGVRLDGGSWLPDRELMKFAQADGFEDPDDMLSFWNTEHPDTALFDGVVIEWRPI